MASGARSHRDFKQRSHRMIDGCLKDHLGVMWREKTLGAGKVDKSGKK